MRRVRQRPITVLILTAGLRAWHVNSWRTLQVVRVTQKMRSHPMIRCGDARRDASFVPHCSHTSSVNKCFRAFQRRGCGHRNSLHQTGHWQTTKKTVATVLELEFTSALSLSVFKNSLKTYLFCRCYETVWLSISSPFPSHYLVDTRKFIYRLLHCDIYWFVTILSFLSHCLRCVMSSFH